jgi:predicted dehydrogenase
MGGILSSSCALQKPIRVAFLGLSAHAEEHLLPALQQLPQFCLSYVVSRSYSKARRFQQRFNASDIALDWRQLLVSPTELDAVLVAGPPTFHEEVLFACLPRAIAVFVEKPCAQSLSRLQLVITCAKANANTPTFVGYNFKYADSFRFLTRTAEALGGVRRLTIRFLTNKPLQPLWAYASVFESYLYAIAIHAIDLTIALIGAPREITATYTSLGSSLFKMEVQIVSCSGIPATLCLGNYAQRFEAEYEAVTDSGHTIKCSPTSLRPWEIVPPVGATAAAQNFAPLIRSKTSAYGYLRALEVFAAVVAGTSDNTSPVQDSLPVYEVIDALLAEHNGR